MNKIDHAVVLLSYPADAIGRKSALRVFLCSDPSLSDEAILEYYSHRWSIEVMFRSHKRYMGLKSFMVRSAKAIDRLSLILDLAFIVTNSFCSGSNDRTDSISFFLLFKVTDSV